MVSSNKIHFDEMFQEIWKVSKLSLNVYLNEYLKNDVCVNGKSCFKRDRKFSLKILICIIAVGNNF